MFVLAEHENVLITQSLHPITYTKNVWVKNLIVHLKLSNLIKRSSNYRPVSFKISYTGCDILGL